MHFLNNATIVVLASTPALQEMFSDPEAPPPLWLVPIAVVALAGGVKVLGSLPRGGELEASPTDGGR